MPQKGTFDDSQNREEKRRHKRINHPRLAMKLDGQTYATKNWSVGGALLLGKFDNKKVGQMIAGRLGLHGEEPRYPFNATIVRLGPSDSTMAIMFIELSDGAFDLLHWHATDHAD